MAEIDKEYLDGINTEVSEDLVRLGSVAAAERFIPVKGINLSKVPLARFAGPAAAAFLAQDLYEGAVGAKDKFGNNPGVSGYASNMVASAANGLTAGLIPEHETREGLAQLLGADSLAAMKLARKEAEDNAYLDNMSDAQLKEAYARDMASFKKSRQIGAPALARF